MPIATQIESATGLRIHKVTGSLTFTELRETLQALYASPDFRPEQNALWDLRDSVLTTFTTAQVREIVEPVRSHWGTRGAPRAALVVCRDADFGMARMYELQLDVEGTAEVRVFRDLEEARVWVLEEPEE